MRYDHNNSSTRYTVGVIARKLGVEKTSIDPDTFCETYDRIREQVCENLYSSNAVICSCGYKHRAQDGTVHHCNICDTDTEFRKGTLRLPEHIMMSPSVSGFVELYREKFYGVANK